MSTATQTELDRLTGDYTIDPAHTRIAFQARHDAHLRSNDFFAMDEYPEIKFVSTSAEKVGDHSFKLNGELTIKGVARTVSIDFEFNGVELDPWGNTRIGFEGSSEVNRKDWGINWNAALDSGGVLVSDKVKLEFDIAATKNA